MSINSSNVLMAKVAVNKSLLKEYNNSEQSERVVYLNNGDDFQIQLFNPERTTIGAEVYVNGEKLSGILVLKPGERIWLERFTDRTVKFKFSTYNVEDGYSEEVQNAIADNGVITVKFFKERKKNYWRCDCGSSMNEKSFKDSYRNDILSLSSTIETGRISEGGYSSQKFNNVNIDFEYCPFRTEVIKILPVSRKPYNSSDLNKIYCTECGRKLNPKYKFCPYCGTHCD